MGKTPITVNVGDVSTTRLANPFDYYRLQGALKLMKEYDLSDFVSEIDPEGSLSRLKNEKFTLKRVKNKLHLIPL